MQFWPLLLCCFALYVIIVLRNSCACKYKIKKYAKELEKLIEAKSKGQQVTIKDEEKTEETTDILEALKASLKVKGKPATAVAKTKRKMDVAMNK
jgi:non-homologous end joining protein Ku